MTEGRRPREALLLAAATVLALLPFAGKAFHVDDTLFLAAARQIRANPFDFYGFTVNWYGTAQPMWGVMKNPPLASYFLALASAVGGWSETALHLAFLVPAVAAVLGTYALARRLSRRPAVAALAALATPAFLVSSTNVMCDTMLVAFWVWAVELWLSGFDTGRRGPLAASAAFVALAALTKYFGAALLPLLFVYGLARKRRLGSWTFWLLLPVAVLAAYQVATTELYGRGLLRDAAAYASGIRYRGGIQLPAKAAVGLSFAGGSVASIGFFLPWLWSRRVLAGAGVAAFLLVLGLGAVASSLPLPVTPGARWAAVGQLVLFDLLGASLLGLASADLLRRRDSGSLLLFLWIVGTFVFAAFFNWTVNTRSILPMVPAAGILLARRLDAKTGEASGRRIFPAAALAGALALALGVAWADDVLAGSARKAAARLVRQFGGPPGTLWFEGHWGFQHYMESAGASPLDFLRSRLAPGDRIAIPSNNTNVVVPQGEALGQLEILELPVLPFLATLSPDLGAGFYLDVWGPLPFAFGRVPRERYVVLVVRQELPPGSLRP